MLIWPASTSLGWWVCLRWGLVSCYCNQKLSRAGISYCSTTVNSNSIRKKPPLSGHDHSGCGISDAARRVWCVPAVRLLCGGCLRCCAVQKSYSLGIGRCGLQTALTVTSSLLLTDLYPICSLHMSNLYTICIRSEDIADSSCFACPDPLSSSRATV